ncbi:FmdB family zinc ribbon protein [Granulibacter bethesdensis]|uniref:FmdB family zinc ribbon protein n=1 Tax=Granulibacter bethesdensis TaxID=364410 RepID=UPI0003F1E26D|nr:zinc ribbon domain-containing protein [Granulibacter bethesdensis]AHJ65718.1 Putative regulatory protein fmdB [Granulibacter bethesdensis CGDNIH4]
MPVYDYHCESCGVFTVMRPMSEFEQPACCPDCGTSAPRVLLTAPSFAAMDSARRTAFATNERSVHAPRRSRGSHPSGCSCCSTTKGKSKLMADSPPAAKSFSAQRPWMISH